MENNEMQGHTHEHDSKCGYCSWAGGMHGHHHHWKYVIIKILVALFIFWCGVQFGELKAMLHAGYYGNAGVYNVRGSMMGGTWGY